MATLLLRLAGPLQSWGADSKFETRKTNREPTKSGVLGIVAAALGLRRDDDAGLARLNTLRFAVRVDREGDLLVDFHTAHRLLKENSLVAFDPTGDSWVTYRHYLADAVFLVGLESDDRAWLGELETALHHPVYPPFLGRRSCPPTPPFCLGVRELPLMAALSREPPLCRRAAATLRVVADAAPGEAGVPVRDRPFSFSPIHRQYGFRPVRETFVPNPAAAPSETDHDPWTELEAR